MKSILRVSYFYELFQGIFGFSNARRIGLNSLLTLKSGDRVLDIGCGPGKFFTYLPRGVDYIGFDVDEAYIQAAKKNYGHQAKFYCQEFDEQSAEKYRHVDYVFLNGVIHHLPDRDVQKLLANIKVVLSKNGQLFTLDGCYREGQNPVSRWLLNNDRGNHVRDMKAYQGLLSEHFESVDGHIREDLSLLPYTFFISVCKVA